MMKLPIAIIALLCLAGYVHGDKKLRRKRIVFNYDVSTVSDRRDLNVIQEGTLDPDEDWDKFFFNDASSMSMSMPDEPKPPTSVNDIYKPVTETILNDYCRSQYGSTSLAVPDHDGVDWFCRATDDVLDEDALYAVSFTDLCIDQFGPSFGEVLIDSNSDGWACVDWTDDDASHIVVPVVIIADDYTSDADGTADAISSTTAAMERVQSWYQRKMKSGRTFRLSRPILKMSKKSAEEWNELSCLTASPADRPEECLDHTSENDRFGYFYEAQAEAMKTSLPRWPSEQLVVIFVYTGPDSDPFWLGAAAAGPYSANPPNIAVCSVDSDNCGLYSIGHEIGHSFGLVHSCEIVKEPKCYNGIMQNPGDAGVLDAVLFGKEQDILDANPYFE